MQVEQKDALDQMLEASGEFQLVSLQTVRKIDNIFMCVTYDTSL